MATTTLDRHAPTTAVAVDPVDPPVPGPTEPELPTRPAAASPMANGDTVPAAESVVADLVGLEQALAGVAVAVGLATTAAVLQQVSRCVAASCELWWAFDHG